MLQETEISFLPHHEQKLEANRTKQEKKFNFFLKEVVLFLEEQPDVFIKNQFLPTNRFINGLIFEKLITFFNATRNEASIRAQKFCHFQKFVSF